MAQATRTGTQKALQIVSIIMMIFGVVVVLAGLISVAAGASLQAGGADYLTEVEGAQVDASALTTGAGAFAIILGVVDLLIAGLGLRGAKDASKIGPYRTLCYAIGAIVFAFTVFGWTQGDTSLWRTPFFLIGNFVFFGVCGTLGDLVKKEREKGIAATQSDIERTGYQKALRIICIVLIILNVIGIIICTLILAVGLGMAAGNATVDMGGTSAPESTLMIVLGTGLLIGTIVNLVIGIVGLRGANNPEKIKPFFWLSVIGVALVVASIVSSLINGTFVASASNDLVDLLLVGSCAWLSGSVVAQNRTTA